MKHSVLGQNYLKFKYYHSKSLYNNSITSQSMTTNQISHYQQINKSLVSIDAYTIMNHHHIRFYFIKKKLPLNLETVKSTQDHPTKLYKQYQYQLSAN